MLLMIKRIWQHMEKRRRRQFFYIFFLSLVSTLLEVVSVGSVLPFIAAITSPDKLFSMDKMSFFISYFNITNPKQMLLPLTIIFISVVLFSGFVRLALLWLQTRFSFSVGIELSSKMYKNSLNQEYLIHTDSNSNKAISDIILKSEMFVDGAILPAVVILNSLFILLALFIFLIVLDPYISIASILSFVSIYLIVSISIKKKLSQYSKTIVENQDKVFQSLAEGFGSIRDIILGKLHKIFLDNFTNIYSTLRNRQASIAILGSVPRYAIESIGMAIIAIIVYSMTNREIVPTYIFPILGSFILAMQRALPSLHAIFSSWANLKGSTEPILDALNLLEQIEPSNGLNNKQREDFSFLKAIEFKNVGFLYKKNSKGVRNINLKINSGECVGVIGETGSGKSTLLDLIMGFVSPQEGEMFVDDVLITKNNIIEWQSNIAHVPQKVFLIDASILDNIAFGKEINQIDFEQLSFALKAAQLSDFIDSLDDGYNTVVGEDGAKLSGGQKQRIGIARALYNKNASLLVFDEATSALDYETELKVIKAILELTTMTILLVSHRQSTLDNCSSLIRIKDGEIE